MGQKHDLIWQWRSFEELSNSDLYDILELRQRVFVVEQNCAYLDCDGNDQKSYHLLGRRTTDPAKLLAYLRIVSPDQDGKSPHIGRILTDVSIRGLGLGRELVQRGVEHCSELFPGQKICISAQHHLENFYREIGFTTISQPYDEDGIPHIAMVIICEQSHDKKVLKFR